jgi:hypothetical protein
MLPLYKLSNYLIPQYILNKLVYMNLKVCIIHSQQD